MTAWLLLASSFLFVSSIQGESEVLVPVAMFKDGLAPNVSMVLDPAAADGGGSPLFNLSLCLRARLLRNSPGAFVTYLTGESDKILDAAFLESWDGTVDFAVFHKMVLGVRSTRIDADVTGDFQFMRWMHLCVTFEVGGQSADPTSEVAVNTTIYVDGRAAVIERLVVNSSSYVGLAPGGSLVVGTNGFSGEIAQVGLWDRVLSEGDVDDLATCRIRDIQGSAVSWSRGASGAEDAAFQGRELSSLCAPDPLLRTFVVGRPSSYSETARTCRNFGGSLPRGRDRDDLDEVTARIKSLASALPEKETWMCLQGSDPMFFYQNATLVGPWQAPPERRCSVVALGRAQTVSCEDQCYVCGYCFLGERLQLKLRGVFTKELYVSKLGMQRMYFDWEYYLYGMLGRMPHFRGTFRSHIYFNDSEMRWTLQSFSDPSVRSRLPVGEVPWGTHLWEPDIFSLRARTEAKPTFNVTGGNKTLTLTHCGADMFTCDDGTCRPLSSRCDKELDCPDRSDERACSFVTLDSDYLEDVMPRDAELKDPVIVHINMSILAIPDIDTVKMQFKADFILSLKWHDLRVRLEHLNKVTVLNTLNNEEIKDLWKPELRFDYTFGPFNVLYDEQVSAKIIRESEPLTDDISRVKETEVFDPTMNSIQMSREYFQDYRCMFELTYFPFDTQTCKMGLTVQGRSDNFVKLAKDGDGVDFQGGRRLVEYEIILEELYIKSVNNVSVAEVIIVFRRQIEYHIYNSIAQALMLILVGYLSYHFDLDDFPDRIMVTLTTMLVIATMTSSIQKDLPKTANFKMLDWWLFFSSNILVITMAFHTYLCYMCKHARLETDGQAPKDLPFTIPRLFVFRKQVMEKQSQLSANESEGTQERALLSGPPGGPPRHAVAKADPLRQPRRFNAVAKITYICVVATFNVVFWSVALKQYFRPPEEFVKDMKRLAF